jgi:hypothetical protein
MAAPAGKHAVRQTHTRFKLPPRLGNVYVRRQGAAGGMAFTKDSHMHTKQQYAHNDCAWA